MKSKAALTTIFISIIGFLNSYSQDGLSLNDTIRIKEVVVTGSPVKVSRNNIPMSVSVLKRHQIAESDESALLPILNGRIPGLFVTERGVTGFGVAQGSAGQISMRGIGGSPTTGVLMLIDGHPQFMGIFGHPLPDSYVASDVERVEVIRGPGSVLYGTNAMGGVINIITKKQDSDGVNANARMMIGSYNTQKYRGSVGYKKTDLVFLEVSITTAPTGIGRILTLKLQMAILKLGISFLIILMQQPILALPVLKHLIRDRIYQLPIQEKKLTLPEGTRLLPYKTNLKIYREQPAFITILENTILQMASIQKIVIGELTFTNHSVL